MPPFVLGRVVKFRMALMPSTFASAVARGRPARLGNWAKTAGVLMTGLIVHGMSASFWLMRVNATVPFTVVRGRTLYMATALTELDVLLRAADQRPCSHPLPLL